MFVVVNTVSFVVHAYSGGSGAYARASLSANKISLQDYNVIYTKVGLGGKSGAKATEIRYL